MSTTRATLLGRVRDPRDEAAWNEFFALYAPLLEGYARALGLAAGDAEEIRDQCLAQVVQRIGEFRYDRAKGSFKGWLHRIARDAVVDALRKPRAAQPQTAELRALPSLAEGPDEAWERRWRDEHLRFALAEVRQARDEQGRALIDLLLERELDAGAIAARTGLSENQVYKARARLVSELRERLRQLGEAD